MKAMDGATVGLGKIIATVLAVALAGFCLCSLALLHSVRKGYGLSPVVHYPRKTQFMVVNASLSVQKPQETVHPAPPVHRDMTELKHLVFGISASSALWEHRKEYVRTWWRPRKTRGYVWFDRPFPAMVNGTWDSHLPPWRVSQNTSAFKYTNNSPWGRRDAIRITRIVSETFRLRLPNVRWFVMGDDDTVFVLENLLSVLNKYDHTQFYYVGGNSESHIQNVFMAYDMAFGGGGFAISYPLAEALEKMQDKCLHRYDYLFGSDDRMHACLAELGVSLTREPGFHQMDITGDAFGLLAAHPVVPLVSLHHMDIVESLFWKRRDKVESVRHLMKAAKADPAGLLQQSICYDRRRKWTFSVSSGYAVQIMRGIVPAREMERPERTFKNWQLIDDVVSYPFNTRATAKLPCQRPFIFEMENITTSHWGTVVRATYLPARMIVPYNATSPVCGGAKIPSPETVEAIHVTKRRDPPESWRRSPRRKCCRLRRGIRRQSSAIDIEVGPCRDGEIISF